MNPSMALIVGLLAGTALLSAHLALWMALRSRGSTSARYMAVLMAASGWWAGLNILEYLATGLPAKLLAADLQYLAIAAIPPLWYSFGVAFEREERLGASRHPLAIIWIVPLLTAILVWADPWIGLVRRNFRLEAEGSFTVIAKEFGPWFWLHSAWSYALVIGGTVFTLRGAGARGRRRTAQVAITSIGTLLPTAANALFLSGALGSLPVDPTPLAFSLTGLLLALNLSRFRFLGLITAARAAAVDQLGDAVLVLDADGRLAYANEAAQRAFRLGAANIGLVLDPRSPIGPLASLRPGEERELRAAGLRFEARAADIERGGRAIGLVLTVLDVTRRAVAEDALRGSNAHLEERIAARTRELEQSNLRLSVELEQRVRTERQITHDALHDPLTGLANRSLLLNRVEQALIRSRRDSGLRFGVLYADFDGFKDINDAHGRDAGDAFLREASSRLRRCFREGDTIARLGGDEFVVLLETSGGAEELVRIAGRLSEELALPFAAGASTILPSSSIGILEAGSGYASCAEVLRDADIARFRAKRSGRNGRALFEEAMRESENERSLLKGELRAAVGSGGIGLAWQPIARMDGSVAGWEVLARWRSPTIGPVGPDRFIPLAEEMGLIVPLGTWVLLESLRVAALLRDEGLLADGRGGLPFFSVNVSAIQLGEEGFAELVLSAIERSALPRSVIHLELTESAIIEDRDAATSVLSELAAAGISFKLDDFGTGYSSLGYLHRIPIDCVKIDKSFIDRIDADSYCADGPACSAGLVRGIISLSHELGKSVVAEGIETAAQAELLRGYGCDFGQGWFYGKPMDRAALEASLRKAQDRESA
jgi:diguanylate cyclase (GGDEF)-like protein